MVANVAYSFLDVALAGRVRHSTVECILDLHDVYGVPSVVSACQEASDFVVCCLYAPQQVLQTGELCLCEPAVIVEKTAQNKCLRLHPVRPPTGSCGCERSIQLFGCGAGWPSEAFDSRMHIGPP